MPLLNLVVMAAAFLWHADHMRSLDVKKAAASCELVSAEALLAKPSIFRGKQLCVRGYLGKMVSFGEDSPKLLTTRASSDNWSSDFISLDLVMNIANQKRLAAHSTERILVSGRIVLDDECWAVRAQNGGRCWPVSGVSIRTDGLRFLERSDPSLSRRLRPSRRPYQ